MKWFLVIFMIQISEYNLSNPQDVKFIKVDKEYSSMQECIDDQPHQTIQQIKKYDFEYDWKVASCNNGTFTIYLHPYYPNKTKEKIKPGVDI